MDWTNPRSVETRIRRLEREIAQINESFYETNRDDDRVLYAGMLERKRDDVVRSAVLQLHTAIEDVLNSQIICHVLDVRPEHRTSRMRSKKARALLKMLFGAGSIGFDMKLKFAAALGLLTSKTQRQFADLNELRNRCAHNWILNTRVRRGKRPKQQKDPLLKYKGRDLHRAEVLKEFTADYGLLHAKLFVRYIR